LSYETINPNPRKLSVIKNQSGPTVTRTSPPQQQGNNENRIVTFPHTLTFINNDAHYKEVKRTPMYVIHKLTFPDPQGEVIWASLKINVLPTYMSHKIKSDEPILYTVISGKFTVLIYEGYDEHSDTLYATEKIAIPPGVVHRFLNRLDDRNSVIVGEFPYDVIVSERSIAGKKEQEVIMRRHQQIDPHPTEENLVPEPELEESHQKSQPPAAVLEKKSQKKTVRTPPQK
jgi:hypothetical protein